MAFGESDTDKCVLGGLPVLLVLIRKYMEYLASVLSVLIKITAVNRTDGVLNETTEL